MTSEWSRHDDADRAVKRILEGAEKAFSELGVSKAGMAEIAEFSGCSRGTLYRYFPTRHDLHVAYVDRASSEIAEQVRAQVSDIEDPRERLVQGILCAVREVRRRPGAIAWFEVGAAAGATRMSRASEVIDTISSAFVGNLLGTRWRSRLSLACSDWLVRSIVSLLSNPAESEADERMIVERFVAPGLLAEDRS